MAGTPEISLMNFMIGQMARFYDVPWRTSNTLGGAKTFDAQAGYESATTLSAVIHASSRKYPSKLATHPLKLAILDWLGAALRSLRRCARTRATTSAGSKGLMI